MFILLVLLCLSYFNNAYALSNSIFYCPNIGIAELTEQQGCYDMPFNKGDYFKLYLKGKRVEKLEEYKEGRVFSTKYIVYKNGKIHGAKAITSEGDDKTLLLTHTFFGTNGLQRGNPFVRHAIHARLNMHNGKSYEIAYTRKLVEYYNNELVVASYYDMASLKERLLVSIYYENEKIVSYRINKYKKSRVVEEYYIGQNSHTRIYNRRGRIALSYYYEAKDKGFNFAVYYYKNNTLSLKEAYYAKGKGNKNLQDVIKKGVSLRTNYTKDKELEKIRHAWARLIKPFSIKDKNKSYNVIRTSTLYFKTSSPKPFPDTRTDNMSADLPANKNKETYNKEHYDRKDPLVSYGVLKVEYYMDGILRRTEHFGDENREDKVEHYNYLEERVFDRE